MSFEVLFVHVRWIQYTVRRAVQGGLVPNKISGVGTNFGLLVHVLPDRGIVIVLRPAPVIYYAQSPLGSLLGSELI